MTTSGHVALLRGINVGGRNRVAMSDLRAALEAAGLGPVSTYIASGNVLLHSASAGEQLEQSIEAALEQHLGLRLVVVVRSHSELGDVVAQAPPGFGDRPDTYLCDAVFLKAPLTPDEVLAAVRPREGVDVAWPGDRVVYFQRLAAQRQRSRLSTLVGTTPYELVTIRSWATTTRLLALLDAEAGERP
jgi:uncharacterized protein (DUF1697 family)